jgi:hypothetical protein
MNEVRMEDGPLIELKENGNVQIERSMNPKTNEEKMKENLKMLRAQRLFWKPNSRNVLCWAFYCVDDNKEVDLITLEIMHFIFCHNNLIFNLNPKTQAKKWFIIDNTTNSIIALKRHDNLDHYNLFFNFGKEINCPLKEYEKQLSKKRPNLSSNSISSFFVTKEPFKKDDVQQKQFLEDLGLLIVKNHLPLQFVKSS